MEEGIKFNLEFRSETPIEYRKIERLNYWRSRLYKHKLIGQYNGVGYGNVSQRLKPFNGDLNKRKFIITGTKTGRLKKLTEEHYTTIKEYYPNRNLIIAEGPITPSSESMTHGMIYDCDNSIRYVFHVHSSPIWRKAKELEMPVTRRNVEYGTPEMAEDVERLFKETNVGEKKIFAMLGHEDGIFSFGRTLDEAGKTMLNYLALAVRDF